MNFNDKRIKIGIFAALGIVIVAGIIILIVSQMNAMKATGQTSGDYSTKTDAEAASPSAKGTGYGVGDTCDDNGLLMTVDSCEKYVYDSKYMKPADGNVYIRVHITFENKSSKKRTVGTTLFDCYSDNRSAQKQYFLKDDDLTSLDSISSGRIAEGYVYYEVSEKGKTELEYNPELYGNKKVIYKLTF